MKTAYAPGQHASYLLDLGFSEALAHEANHALELGLFDMEASDEIVHEIIERCQAVFEHASKVEDLGDQEISEEATDEERQSAEFDRDATWAVQAFEAGLPVAAFDFEPAFHFALPITLEWLETEWVANAASLPGMRGRPWMLVDNHAVVDPIWWERDSGFSTIRNTCRQIDRAAKSADRPAVAVLVVLLPDAETYSEEQALSFGRFLATTWSDVWIVSHDRAGTWRDKDVIVGIEGSAITLRGRPTNPAQAFMSFERHERSVTAILRDEILRATQGAMEIRSGGKAVGVDHDLRTEKGVRDLIKMVCTGTWPRDTLEHRQVGDEGHD